MGFGYGSGADVAHNATARDLESGDCVGQSFTTDMAAHVWAQRRQTFGRSSKGVVYFHGAALFDYGAHFCTAWLMPDGVALINDSSPSPTTSGHVYNAQYAARGRTIRVPDLTGLLAGSDGASLHVPAYASGGSVEGTRRFESDVMARLGDRAHVRGFCERHALELGADALQYLLELVGLPNSAAKIVRDAEAARDRAKREREAIEKREAIQLLRNVASGTDSDFAEREGERARVGHYRHESAVAYHLSDLGKRIRKARRAAGKASVPGGIWRKAWDRLQRISLEGNAPDSLVPAVESAWARGVGAALRADRRRAIRSALANWKAPQEARDNPGPDAHEWQRLMADVRHAERKATEAGRLAQAIAALWPNAFAEAIAALNAFAEERDAHADAQRKSPAMAEARAAWDREREERERAERAERERIERENLARWRAGERVGARVYASRESGAAYIRAMDVERDESGNITGGTLETSQGASVPLVQAVRAFRFVKLVRERGEPWHRNGQRARVGHFELDSIDASGGFRAGCHAFEWRDVEELARSLGVADLAPDSAIVTYGREAA